MSSRSASQGRAIDRDVAKSSPFLALYRALSITCFTIYCYCGYMVQRLIARTDAGRYAAVQAWVGRWYPGLVKRFGWEVTCRGELPDGAALLTPNHLGYADIPALGSVAPCFFVAKADVESWPFIRILFTHSLQIAVDRARIRTVREANEKIRNRLRNGFQVGIFLEGTSSGGGEVKAFQPSLIEPAIAENVPVVPIAIRWSASDPLVDISEDVAYWKDHVFVRHLWRLLGLRGLKVQITFGQPIVSSDSDRKALAQEAHRRVVSLLET